MATQFKFMYSAGFVALVTFAGYLFFTNYGAGTMSNELTIINTEVGLPDSFDPVDADKTQNISSMRLLYQTPLFINSQNELSSSVLSEFSYFPDSKLARFRVKANSEYSNGERMTSFDLAMAIARFGYFHPDFPVIKKIIGLQNWANRKKGLFDFPEGIQVKGSEVELHFEGALNQPLFRFCLEIFSIIPASAIDLASGKLNTDIPPFSGPYRLLTKSDQGWIFERIAAHDPTSGEDYPYKKISIITSPISSICSRDLAKDEIATGFEMDYLMGNCGRLNPRETIWLPASRFGILRFNTKNALFKDAEARACFSDLVREELKREFKNLQVERGLFTRLLPGFLSSQQLSPPQDKKWRSFFKGKTIVLPKSPKAASWFIYNAIGEVGKALSMRIEFLQREWTSKDLVDSFVDGKLQVIFGGSGFWAQDPVGDLEMYFTKHFHKSMTFVWEDDGIYSRLDKISESSDTSNLKSSLEDFNRYVFEKSIVAPILHFRRFYRVSPGQQLSDLPQAVTSPAPWQLRLKVL